MASFDPEPRIVCSCTFPRRYYTPEIIYRKIQCIGPTRRDIRINYRTPDHQRAFVVWENYSRCESSEAFVISPATCRTATTVEHRPNRAIVGNMTDRRTEAYQ